MIGLLLAVAIAVQDAKAPFRIGVSPADDIQEVFARVKALPEAVRRNGIEVLFAPGDYCFNREVVLESGHSGRPGALTVFRAAQPGTVRFCGGVKLGVSSFGPVPKGRIRDRLKSSVRDRIRVTDISPYVDEMDSWPDNFRNPPGPWLYLDGEPMTLARYPNDGWIRFSKAVRTGFENADNIGDGRKAGPGAICWEGDTAQAKSWNLDDGMWLYGYWTHDWAEEFLRVNSLEETATNLVINLKGTHAYGIVGNKTYGAKKRRYFVLNLPEELDAPGEFWIDRKERKLYLYPPHEFVKTGICLAVLERPFVRTADSADVHHIRFDGLSFVLAHALGFALDLQSHDVTFADCEFVNLGGNGISLKGSNNLVLHSRFRNIGAMAAFLDGGDAKTLTCAKNAILDCEISHYARFVRTYAPAVRCEGVGQAVVGCRIHDGPHQAISYKGQSHRLMRNEIYNVLTETSDSGAIYMGRRTDMVGTLIAGNYFHDLAQDDAELRLRTYAVYFDDCGWGTDVISNRFERLGTGVIIGGGNVHRIEGNVFVDCKCGISCDARGRTWKMFKEGSQTGVSWFESWLLPHEYRQGVWHERFPELEKLIADRPDVPRLNAIIRNRFENCQMAMEFYGAASSFTNEMPVAGNVIIRRD